MKFFPMILAVFWLHLHLGVYGIEEPSPEVFLQPRNFNPHPYELGYDPRTGDRQISRLREYAKQIDIFGGSAAADDRGPILFPANGQPAATHSADNSVTQDPYLVEQLKNTHPYAGVAAKKAQKYGASEQVNPQVYNALAAHGAKVLSVPRANDLKDIPNFVEQYDYPDQTKKNYAFSYKVVDHLTGDDFSHSQSQDSHATNGEYRVKLPDGRVQIVSYTADSNGYKADVKYAGDKRLIYATPPPAARHRFAAPAPTHQHLNHASLATAAAAASRPLQHAPLYTTGGTLHHPHDDTAAATATALKSHAHDFINQHLITDDAQYRRRPVAAAQYDPVLFILSDKYRSAAAAETEAAKVQLLPNIHAQKVPEHGKFIAATLTPYIGSGGGGADVSGGGGASFLSTLAPDLDKFNPLYIDAQKYKLPTIH